MNEIDACFRAHRADVPPPPAERAAAVATSVLTGAVTPPRARRVAAVLAMGAATVVVLAGMGAVVRHRLDRHAPRAPATSLVQARVDWGMDAVIQLAPDPASSPELMRGRLTATLAQWAAASDRAGVTVTPLADARIRVRLPGASARWQAQSLLHFKRLGVFDADRDVLAMGTTLADVRAAAAATRRRGGATVYYVRRSGALDVPPLRLADPARARAFTQGWRGPTETIAASAKTELIVLPTPKGRRVMLLRSPGRIPSRAITDVADASRDGVTAAALQLDRALVPPDTRRVILVAHSDAGADSELGTEYLGRGHVGTDRSQLNVTIDGRVSPGALAQPSAIRHPDLAGTLRMVAAVAYGTRPAEAGGSEVLPGDLSGLRRIPGAEYRRVLVVERSEGSRVELVAAIRRSVAIAVSNGTGVESGPAMCDPGVGTPRVVRCITRTQPLPTFGGNLLTRVSVAGRYRDGVARIAMRLPGGATSDATMRDGWFYVEALHSRRGPAAPEEAPEDPTVLAWDPQGNPIPVNDP